MTDRLLSDPMVVSRGVMHGSPHIMGTHIVIAQVVNLLAVGTTPFENMSDYYPDLTEADIRACIAYLAR